MIDKKILLVEDGDYKSKSVLSYLEIDLSCNNVDVVVSYSSAVRALASGLYELAIIDMSLPTFDQNQDELNNDFRALAGLDIARQISRRNIEIKFVFLTQYESLSTAGNSMSLHEINEFAKDKYPDAFKGAIFYEHSGSQWKEKLKEFVTNA
ncbi:TPA: response regulator [Vibrio harveyi]|uniref:response regulator n=2 Tax=Vibrio harveyi group TaxID=717610 RepID=UPI002FEFDFA4|nr:response regulator [Vibrio harveyi]